MINSSQLSVEFVLSTHVTVAGNGRLCDHPEPVAANDCKIGERKTRSSVYFAQMQILQTQSSLQLGWNSTSSDQGVIIAGSLETFRITEGQEFCPMMFKKKKTAPRSGEQYKIGPPFGTTKSVNSILLSSNNKEIMPIISARIDRGFDKVNDEWIGYKRNYFTLVASFQFQNLMDEQFSKEGYKVIINNSISNISYFTMRMIAMCCEDNLEAPLVQHTAKRDRGPQNPPPEQPVITSLLPGHEIIKQVANIRNDKKINLFNQLFNGNISNYGKLSKHSIFKTYPSDQITKVCRYERVQFASSLDCKKTVTTSKHFILKIELMAVIDNGQKLLLAFSQTPPLIIRGRSPSNYKGPKPGEGEITKSIKESEPLAKTNNIPVNMPNKTTIEEEMKSGKEISRTVEIQAIKPIPAPAPQTMRKESSLVFETSSNVKILFDFKTHDKGTKSERGYKVVKPLYSNVRNSNPRTQNYFASLKKISLAAKSSQNKNINATPISNRSFNQQSKREASQGSADSGIEYFRSNENSNPDLDKTALLDFPIVSNFNLQANYKLTEIENHGIVVKKTTKISHINSHKPIVKHARYPKFFSSPIKPISKHYLRLPCRPVSASKTFFNDSLTEPSSFSVNPKMLSTNSNQ